MITYILYGTTATGYLVCRFFGGLGAVYNYVKGNPGEYRLQHIKGVDITKIEILAEEYINTNEED